MSKYTSDSQKLPDYRVCTIDTLKKRLPSKTAEKLEGMLWCISQKLESEYEDDIQEIYKKISYEKIGMLLSSNSETRKKIVEDIKNLKIGWDSCVFDNIRENRDRQNSERVVDRSSEIKEGEFHCRDRNCGSKRCYFFELQTRSADESMTVYVVCTKCAKRYRYN